MFEFKSLYLFVNISSSFSVSVLLFAFFVYERVKRLEALAGIVFCFGVFSCVGLNDVFFTGFLSISVSVEFCLLDCYNE